jgi:hypothetical protein
MKTPLSITVSVWNYCQNSCIACPAGSSAQKWKFNGNFEIFSPSGCENMTDLQTREIHGADYYRKMCPDKNRFLNKKDVLNFAALETWIYRNCILNLFPEKIELHISGGEPLLRPDIEDRIQQLLTLNDELIVETGHHLRITIFTNGLLISKRPRLLDMPLKWVVAHHMPNSLDKWLKNARLVANRPHMACRILLHPNEVAQKEQLQEKYCDLHFHWIRGNGLRQEVWEYNADDLDCIASRVIHLIVPDGRVFPCNVVDTAPIGHIHRMTYSPELAAMQDAHAKQCVTAGSCPAYQSAVLVSNL